jgi:acetylornithine deacetylase/succinyl-diaminopimelate desuccinylase-like protein
MAALVQEVAGLPQPTHPRLGRRDVNCIDVRSEPYPSVSTIPATAVARFDCRFLPGETPESVVALLRDAAARAWASLPERPGLDVALVQAGFETWTGQRFQLPEYAAAWWTPEDSTLVRAATGIPTIGFGVGVESMAHQVDEHVTLDSLRAGAQGYAALAAMALAP